MRVIQKQISLEDFTSRLPGVVPAYVPGTSTPICFDEASLNKRDNAYPSNYGLVPMNVKKDGKCYSWETISDWYHFYTDYYHLLNDWSHCNRTYTSAHGFYIGETRDRHYDSLPYGTSESTYIELDNLFNHRKALISYDYICENLIPSIDIPSKYQDYWQASKLFYPDYIKWKGWFTNRHSLYGEYEDSTECSKAADCCDCTEYFNRGGNDMYDLLIRAKFTIPTNTGNCCNPEFITDISLLVSIDDMGEFSIFSEEYNLGTDYRTGTYGSTDNTNGGTVVSVSGNAMTLNDKPVESEIDYTGFRFNEDYMEKYYDKDQWDVHNGNTIVNGIPEEDANVRYYQETRDNSKVWSYAFKKDLSRVIRSGDDPIESENNVRQAIAETFPVTQIKSILIDKRLFAVNEEEFGYYNNKRYYVYRDKYTDTPYTTINGRVLYANVLSTPSADKYFYFKVFSVSTSSTKDECNNTVNTLKYKTFPRTRESDETELEEFVIYNGGTYVVEDNKVTINGTVYDVLTGTFENEYGLYFIMKNKVYFVNEYSELVLDNDYTYNEDEKTATKNTNELIKVYRFGIVTGFTTSKIYDLASSDLLVDDTGTKLEGRRPEVNLTETNTTYNYQPKEGEVLELLYEVGNTSKRIEKMSTLTTDDIDAEINYFFGSIITKMEFYFLDKLGNEYGRKRWTTSSLSTINSMDRSSAETTAFSRYTSLEDGVYCDIEYCVGATLQRKPGGKLELAENTGDKKFCRGVIHKETVRFIKKDVQYNLSTGIDGQIPTTENSVSANNLSYPVTIYELDQFNKNDDFKAIAYFEMELPKQSDWEGYEYSIQCFPVLREEYKFGNSVLQNVDGDIYINRGINAAFEKHLKLGEVTSMEALEQYGNGYFKFEGE